jgi:hypothetical protein
VESSGDAHSDAGALVVLVVRSHHDQDGVGDHEGEQRLFVEARMGVDDQEVEAQVLNQPT